MPFVLKRTVTETFLSRVAITPDQVAFRFRSPESWHEVTFSAFYVEARLVSFGLMSLGVVPNDRVAIVAGTRYEWTLSDMAILGARGVTVPIYASNSAEDLYYILNHSESRVAFLEDEAQLEKLEQALEGGAKPIKSLETIVLFASPRIPRQSPVSKRVITLAELKLLGESEEQQQPGRFTDNLNAATPGDLVTICYTSGTTGVPKGALLTHDNMITVLTDCLVLLEKEIRQEGEVSLSFLPFSHILGKLESVAVYVFGWIQVFATDLAHLHEDFREVRPTLVFAVPRTFEKAHELVLDAVAHGSDLEQRTFEWACNEDNFCRPVAKKRFSITGIEQPLRRLLAKQLIFRRVAAAFGGRLRFAVCGGAPLPREIGEFFQMAGITILEGYGLTETCAPVTLNTPERLRFGTVGRPMPEVTLKVAEDGEILIKSRRLFRGYYKMPEETAEALRDGWFHTGDVGNLDKDGFLEITDRKKDIIITSGGKSIAPQKIENRAMLDKLIHQFVVHGDKRPYLTALLTLNRDTVLEYAHRHNILFSEYSELVKNPRIIILAQRAIDRMNEQLASYETIKKFIVLAEDFAVDTGELTPSLKFRRSTINRKYESLLNSMYAKPARPLREA